MNNFPLAPKANVFRIAKFSFFIIFITFILVEVFLRFTGWLQTYSERIGNGYLCYYGQSFNTWFHHWPASRVNCFNQSEFKFCYPYNSLGFRDKEWLPKKKEGMKRLIVLGDSFTEGDGASPNHNFPFLLEKRLVDKEKMKWEVFNGGACGNDVFYCFRFYETKVLLTYDHDLVLVVINNSDIDDYYFRGGMERFYPDSSTHFKKAPWFEPLFHYSHLGRLLGRTMVNEYTLLNKSEQKELTTRAIHDMAQILNEFNRLALNHNKKFMVVIHPIPWQVGLKKTNEEPIVQLEPLLNHLNVPCINLAKSSEAKFRNLPYEQFAWKINGHFNDYGYKLLSELIYEELVAKNPDTFVGHGE
jgi:lysophospholipase L1-like esterase